MGFKEHSLLSLKCARDVGLVTGEVSHTRAKAHFTVAPGADLGRWTYPLLRYEVVFQPR